MLSVLRTKRIILVATIRTTAILSSSVLLRARAKPTPRKKGCDQEDDPVKRQQQLVQRWRPCLEPEYEANQQERDGPHDKKLPWSSTINHSIRPESGVSPLISNRILSLDDSLHQLVANRCET